MTSTPPIICLDLNSRYLHSGRASGCTDLGAGPGSDFACCACLGAAVGVVGSGAGEAGGGGTYLGSGVGRAGFTSPRFCGGGVPVRFPLPQHAIFSSRAFLGSPEFRSYLNLF